MTIDEHDYESLPEGHKIQVHMMAGSVAGMFEHCLLYPVDLVKTRMQRLQPEEGAYRNFQKSVMQLIKNEGIRGSYRGLPAMVSGAGPAHAMYFATYEGLKTTFATHAPMFPAHASYTAAGLVATLLHDSLMCPAEVVKQRMQMIGSPYSSSLQCAKHVYATEGIHAFYRSYTTQLTLNVPFQCIHFSIYEKLQTIFNSDRKYSPLSHMLSGGIAGSTAAALTTPLDVCKTLLNTQEAKVIEAVNNTPVKGMVNAVKTVYYIGGPRAFMRGIVARTIYQFPSTACCWSVYEFFKYAIPSHSHGK